MGDPTVAQIIKKVESYRLKSSIIVRNRSHLNLIIKKLGNYIDAEQGDLSWIAPTNFRSFRPESFNGSLLISPVHFKAPSLSQFVTIVAENPKLLFAKIASDFFFDLTQVPMPLLNQSSIYNDAAIHKTVKLAHGVVIGPGVAIKKNVSIGPNTVVANCHIGENSVVGANCSIGLPGFGLVQDLDGSYVQFPHIGRVIIGKNVRVSSNTCIDRGGLGDTIIGDGVKIDNLVHIAHNVRIGKNSLIIANTMLGGSTTIKANAWVAPSASLLNKVTVEEGSLIGMGAVVIKDVEKNCVVVGNPARVIRRTRNKSQ